MAKENNNSRSTFLKKLTMAFVSVFGLGLATFSFQKLQGFIKPGFKSLSKTEANTHISKLHFSEVMKIKPESPPKFQQTSERLQTNEI
ncbi:MAG: hypothetical protein GQ564_23170 [Bacteroidales bacterium]|nr:hypothetical protein [Bacteroidales bacterium]